MHIREYVGGVRFGSLGRLYFALQRKRQYFGCKVQPSLAQRPDIVEALVEDGIYVLENFVTREDCEKILRETSEAVTSALGGDTRRDDAPPEGVAPPTPGKPRSHVRLLGCDDLSPTARRVFFENDLIDSVARAYVSPYVHSNRREIDAKESVGQNLQAELVHFDDWRHRFKAFLYLTDVGPENAPFVYYRRSHRPAPWRERHELEFELGGGTQARHGHLFPQELPTVFGGNDYPEKVCIAPAGTLILADFRGLHRATMLKAGRRVMLNKTFTMPPRLLEDTLLRKRRRN